MCAIVLQSLWFGVTAALGCVAISLSYWFAHGTISEYIAYHLIRPHWCNKIEYLGDSCSLPALVFHPAFLTVYAYGLINAIPAFSHILSPLHASRWGIVSLAIILHLPVSHLAFRRVPIKDYLRQYSLLGSLGSNKLGAVCFAVIFPLAVECVQIFLVLVVLIQGMIFVPSLNMAMQKETIGRALYDALTSETLSPKTAFLLACILLLQVIVALVGSYLLVKYSQRLRPWAALLVTSARTETRPGIVFDSHPRMLTLLIIILLLPTGIIGAFYLSFVFTSLYIVVSYTGRFGVSSLWSDFVSSNYDTPLAQVCSNTVNLALLVSMVVCTLIFFLLWIVGRGDKWKLGISSWRLEQLARFFCPIPACVYAYLFIDCLRTPIYGTMVMLFALSSTSLVIVATQREILGRMINAEHIRRSLGAGLIPFWQDRFAFLFAIASVLFIWVGLHVWNDVSIQLFASPQFQGLPTRLIAIARDNISESTATIFLALQLVSLVLALPALIALQKWRRL